MKFLEVLAAVLALLLESVQGWRKRKDKEQVDEAADDPVADLERRGWMRDEPGEPVSYRTGQSERPAGDGDD